LKSLPLRFEALREIREAVRIKYGAVLMEKTSQPAEKAIRAAFCSAGVFSSVWLSRDTSVMNSTAASI
jgi:hypothetical protein